MSNRGERNPDRSFKKIYLLFSFATFFSFFLALNLKKIIALFGTDFNEGYYVILVMLFYPIHQVFGQSADAILLSMEKTKLFKSLRICLTVFGFILTYILIAPRNLILPGLELGAFGLALKMVLGQVMDVHLRLFYSCKYIGLKFFSLLKKEISILFFAGGYYLLIDQVSKLIFGSSISNNGIVDLLLTLIIYSFLTLIIIVIFPSIIACDHSDLRKISKGFK